MYVYLVTIGTIFNNANEHINVYGDDIEVDYRGYQVSVAYSINDVLWAIPISGHATILIAAMINSMPTNMVFVCFTIYISYFYS